MSSAFKPIVKITSNVILGGYKITSVASSVKCGRGETEQLCITE
jgi:hypothetical protein